ncbi:MAG: hypothetical protein WDM86_16890 [Rhizomicrobium sp.]
MSKLMCVAIAGLLTICVVRPADAKAPQGSPPAVIPAGAPPTIDARPWPRHYSVGGTAFALYRPQLESWTDNLLKARAVMTVKTGTARGADGKPVDQQTFGVVWLHARTETDRDAREVTLTDIGFDRVNFPTKKDQETRYLGLLRQVAPTTDLVVGLDQMEAALAFATSAKVDSVAVDNTPPEILFAFEPSVLVPIDGPPVWKPASIAGVERVINTRALLLRYQNRIYFGYGAHWASAAALDGAWTSIAGAPLPLVQVMQRAVATNQAPAAKDVPADIASLFRAGKFPVVYVRTRPAELIQLEGQPQFAQLAGTALTYVSNTPADVFVAPDRSWYVLVSGRWFAGPSSKGPWRYVAPNALPADFAKIPSNSPKSAVLASVAGTPEAREAVIANSIPQTATVDRTKVSFQSHYDGPPKYQAIAGTTMSYALNASVPIIQVPGASYYALSNGVWFISEGVNGPWGAATRIPAAIYTIPAASPVHYVTYARVYGANGNAIYVGYTPGYYGTVVSNGVVVYGTGYACNSWVGNVWYGCPATYGYGAAFAYGAAVGWAIAFGYGWYDPWFDPWWGPWGGYYPGYYHPWAYGGAIAANVYGRWGNSVVAGTAAAWANPRTGNYGRGARGGYYNPVTGGRGYGYGARNTNIYTGRSTAAAGGIRYNPQTGRVVAGAGGSARNIYNGNAAAGGRRTVINTDTGRVMREAGSATRTGNGATAAGGFATHGAGGNAAGAGYVHYDRATGNVSHGGAVDVNGNIYAGHDGNVYHYDRDNHDWEKAGGDGRFTRASQADPSLDRERAARDRGVEREQGRATGGGRQGGFGGSFRGRAGGGRSGGFHGFRGR